MSVPIGANNLIYGIKNITLDQIRSRFHEMDGNQDGDITKNELYRFRDEMWARHMRGEGSHGEHYDINRFAVNLGIAFEHVANNNTLTDDKEFSQLAPDSKRATIQLGELVKLAGINGNPDSIGYDDIITQMHLSYRTDPNTGEPITGRWGRRFYFRYDLPDLSNEKGITQEDVNNRKFTTVSRQHTQFKEKDGPIEKSRPKTNTVKSKLNNTESHNERKKTFVKSNSSNQILQEIITLLRSILESII